MVQQNHSNVAPHAGAWIEMEHCCTVQMTVNVAPHAGAWIEICAYKTISATPCVAPHAGAWIEIRNQKLQFALLLRRSPRGSVD